MKILQVTSSRFIGGGERHVADLSRALSERGHDVFVGVTPDAAIRAELSFLPPGRIVEFRLRNSADVRSALDIAKFARANAIDLIHAHVARDYPVAAVAARVSRIPFVITRHVLFPMNRLHRILLRNVSAVMAPSDAVAESLRRQKLFLEEKIVTIRHGLDASRYVPRRVIGREGFVAGSIGNLDPVKGFDVLVRAAADVTKHISNVKFEIAGDDRTSDGRNRRELIALISSLNLNDRVGLTGWSEDTRETLAGFDIFVSASRSESFGYAIAEAMLSGVPVIATETEGAKEIFGGSEAGVLVPVDSPDDLAKAIIELLNDRTKRDSYARAGRDHVERNFSINRMIDETEALYRQVLDMP
jgi:glycosyltransferase involved in cell wall biosynthesis